MNHTFEKVTDSAYWGGRVRVLLMQDDDSMTFREGTTFAFLMEGAALIGDRYTLTSGMYASFLRSQVRLIRRSKMLAVTITGYRGLFTLGGEIERDGRLQYIDGCRDTVLIPPTRKGEPCLNYLHFPPNVKQTMHTHPSLRVGVVARGNGLCVTPWGSEPLNTGDVFLIKPSNGVLVNGHAMGSHCFETDKEPMDIVAFHETSDWGPTDEAHPMIAQTKFAVAR